MTIDPTNRKKTLVLLVAVAAVLAYVGLVVAPKLFRGTAEVVKADDRRPTTEGGSALHPAPNTLHQADDLYADVEAPMPVSRNPFASPIPEFNPAAQVAIAPAASAGVSPLAVALPPGVPAKPEQWPAIEVLGVMPGEHAVALLRLGDRTVSVRAGHALEIGVTVAKIGLDGVVFHWKGRSETVAVGHTTPAIAVTATAKDTTPVSALVR